jgi:conjugal transfer/entry exclusion protein
MSWKEYHSQSTELASQAQVLKWQGELAAAKQYYAMAATAESKALAAIVPEQTRTLGITAVSAVALWYKAEEFLKAKQLAYQCLANQTLPEFAVIQLEEILKEILNLEAAAVAV